MDVDITRCAAAKPADFAQRALPLQRLAPPAADELHVWHLDLGQLGASLQAALDGHHKVAERVRLTPGQLKFGRRFYLRLLLGAYLDVPGKSVHLTRNHKGKPILDGSVHDAELHFSMAKSGDRLLIGFSSTHPVGVDLEPLQRRARNARGVAGRYFSPAEAERLGALEGPALDAAFLRTWACKEAVVKASGLGIANQLCRFTVETDPALGPAVLEVDGVAASGWALALLQPEDGFLGAVAVEGPIERLDTWRLAPAAAEPGRPA